MVLVTKGIMFKKLSTKSRIYKNLFILCQAIKISGWTIIDSNIQTGFLGFLICFESLLQLYSELILPEKLKFLPDL